MTSSSSARPRPGGSFRDAAATSWWSGVVVALLVLLGGSAYTLLAPQDWESYAVVSFTPQAESAIAPDSVALVAQRYAVVVTSDASADAIAAAVDDGFTGDDLAGNITTTLEAGTGNLRIVVTLDARGNAVQAANAAADFLVAQAADDSLVTADLSAAATDRGATLTPPRFVLAAATLVAAVTLGLISVVLTDRFRRVRREDVRAGAGSRPAPDRSPADEMPGDQGRGHVTPGDHPLGHETRTPMSSAGQENVGDEPAAPVPPRPSVGGRSATSPPSGASRRGALVRAATTSGQRTKPGD